MYFAQVLKPSIHNLAFRYVLCIVQVFQSSLSFYDAVSRHVLSIALSIPVFSTFCDVVFRYGYIAQVVLSSLGSMTPF